MGAWAEGTGGAGPQNAWDYLSNLPPRTRLPGEASGNRDGAEQLLLGRGVHMKGTGEPRSGSERKRSFVTLQNQRRGLQGPGAIGGVPPTPRKVRKTNVKHKRATEKNYTSIQYQILISKKE